MKFVKKPVVIEAMQLTRESFFDIIDWIDSNDGRSVGWGIRNDIGTHLLILTLEGNMRVSLTDWVIRGVKGEFYLCKDDIFKMTYEEVKE